MRTDSPGRAISSWAWAMRGSCRNEASTASRSTVSRPASYRVAAPKATSVTGKVPSSRRMGDLLGFAGRQRVEERRPRHADGQGLQRGGHDAQAEGIVFVGTQRGVATDV